MSLSSNSRAPTEFQESREDLEGMEAAGGTPLHSGGDRRVMLDHRPSQARLDTDRGVVALSQRPVEKDYLQIPSSRSKQRHATNNNTKNKKKVAHSAQRLGEATGHRREDDDRRRFSSESLSSCSSDHDDNQDDQAAAGHLQDNMPRRAAGDNADGRGNEGVGTPSDFSSPASSSVVTSAESDAGEPITNEVKLQKALTKCKEKLRESRRRARGQVALARHQSTELLRENLATADRLRHAQQTVQQLNRRYAELQRDVDHLRSGGVGVVAGDSPKLRSAAAAAAAGAGLLLLPSGISPRDDGSTQWQWSTAGVDVSAGKAAAAPPFGPPRPWWVQAPAAVRREIQFALKPIQPSPRTFCDQRINKRRAGSAKEGAAVQMESSALKEALPIVRHVTLPGRVMTFYDDVGHEALLQQQQQQAILSAREGSRPNTAAPAATASPLSGRPRAASLLSVSQLPPPTMNQFGSMIIPIAPEDVTLLGFFELHPKELSAAHVVVRDVFFDPAEDWRKSRWDDEGTDNDDNDTYRVSEMTDNDDNDNEDDTFSCEGRGESGARGEDSRSTTSSCHRLSQPLAHNKKKTNNKTTPFGPHGGAGKNGSGGDVATSNGPLSLLYRSIGSGRRRHLHAQRGHGVLGPLSAHPHVTLRHASSLFRRLFPHTVDGRHPGGSTSTSTAPSPPSGIRSLFASFGSNNNQHASTTTRGRSNTRAESGSGPASRSSSFDGRISSFPRGGPVSVDETVFAMQMARLSGLDPVAIVTLPNSTAAAATGAVANDNDFMDQATPSLPVEELCLTIPYVLSNVDDLFARDLTLPPAPHSTGGGSGAGALIDATTSGEVVPSVAALWNCYEGYLARLTQSTFAFAHEYVRATVKEAARARLAFESTLPSSRRGPPPRGTTLGVGHPSSTRAAPLLTTNLSSTRSIALTENGIAAARLNTRGSTATTVRTTTGGGGPKSMTPSMARDGFPLALPVSSSPRGRKCFSGKSFIVFLICVDGTSSSRVLSDLKPVVVEQEQPLRQRSPHHHHHHPHHRSDEKQREASSASASPPEASHGSKAKHPSRGRSRLNEPRHSSQDPSTTTTTATSYMALHQCAPQFILRRYNDFKLLQKDLRRVYPHLPIPNLPSNDRNTIFSSLTIGELRARQEQLSAFLKQLLVLPELSVCPLMAAFLTENVMELDLNDDDTTDEEDEEANATSDDLDETSGGFRNKKRTSARNGVGVDMSEECLQMDDPLTNSCRNLRRN